MISTFPRHRCPTCRCDNAAPVQATHILKGKRRSKNAPGFVIGTISWEEHEKAWAAYAARNEGQPQSAEEIYNNGGFRWDELCEFLGHEPKTWKPMW